MEKKKKPTSTSKKPVKKPTKTVETKKKPASKKPVKKVKKVEVKEVVSEVQPQEEQVVLETPEKPEEVVNQIKEASVVETLELAEEIEEPEVKEEVVVNTDNLSAYDHKMIDNDIRFKGPFSYRGLRIFAWMALTVGIIAVLLSVLAIVAVMIERITPEQGQKLNSVSEVMSLFSAMPLPLFLIANFAIILQKEKGYKKLLLTYGAILLAIYVGFLIVYYHYIVGIISKVYGLNFLDARAKSMQVIQGSESDFVVNVFIDLFACALIMYFIDYKPKKYFQGKKIIIFRLLSLLPILYEVGSATLLGLFELSKIWDGFQLSLPIEILPLIGKKPIGMIIAFVLICLYVKLRYVRYLKKGGTPEGYKLFQKTNRNSFRFARNMALIFLVVGIIDAAIMTTLTGITYSQFAEDEQFLATQIIAVYQGFSIGKSACLILVIPFVLLFSYLKKPKNPELDKFVPAGGIILVVFAVFETAFLGLLWL